MTKTPLLIASALVLLPLTAFAQDGFIARDEYKGRRPEMFDQMDADKDGKLTKDEMIAFMKARMSQQGGQRPGGGAASSSSSGGK